MENTSKLPWYTEAQLEEAKNAEAEREDDD